MVVRIFNLTTNVVLTMIFLSIIGTSFVSTLGLSPSSLPFFDDSNVLGTATKRGYNLRMIELTENNNLNNFTIRKLNVNNLEKFSVISKVTTNRKISDNVLTILNKSETIRSLKISLATSIQNRELAKFGIEVNGEERLLIDGNEQKKVIINIGPNQTLKLGAFMVFKSQVNFPIGIELNVINL